MNASEGAAGPKDPKRGWPAIVLVVAPGVLLGMAVTTVAPVLPSIAAQFGGGSHGGLVAQYIVAMSGVGVMVGAPIGGAIGDRVGLRPVLIVSALFYALAGMSAYFVNDLVPLLGARFLMGVGAGAYAAVATALLGQLWKGPTRAHLLGLNSVAGAGGGIATVMLAGMIGRTWGWHAPMLLYGLAAPLALLALTVGDAEAEADDGAMAAAPNLRKLLPLFLMSLPLYMVLFSPTTQLPLILAEVGTRDAGVRSMVLASMTVFSGLAGLIFASLYRGLGPKRLLIVILAFYGAGLVAMGLITGPLTAVVSCALCGVGTGLLPGYFNHVVLDHSSTAIRGRALAALVAVHYVAQFLNPVVIGTLGAVIGMRPALFSAAAVLLAWAVLSTPRALRATPGPVAP